ncbi:MAG: NB-ARC domain-containing protein [Anaerolineae bacterium]|jgi:hypothetical protein|nr:NB-ARC domain-containing protein [Anaerolineae bacterium]
MADPLKPDFVSREQLNQVIKHLITTDDPAGITSQAALKGMGGYGKTTLAQAVCHDPRIWAKFIDGILWVTLGENFSDARPHLLSLYQLLTGKTSDLTDINAIKNALTDFMIQKKKRILLVIDDVWQSEHLASFLLPCALLITTRNRDTLPRNTPQFLVEEMQRGEALTLIGADRAGLTDKRHIARTGDRGRKRAV